MTLKRTTISVTAALFLGALMVSSGNTQQTAEPQKVVQLTGLTGVRDNTKGTLSVENANLHFIHNEASVDVSAASIPDGASLLERDVNGKVRFFGGNLKATYDFAKKAAHVAHENFFSPERE